MRPVYLQPNFASVMAQMVWDYNIFGVLIAVTLYLSIKSPSSRALRKVMIVGIPVALFAAGAVGALLGVVPSRPAWREGLLPVQFPVLAIASRTPRLQFSYLPSLMEWGVTLVITGFVTGRCSRWPGSAKRSSCCALGKAACGSRSCRW